MKAAHAEDEAIGTDFIVLEKIPYLVHQFRFFFFIGDIFQVNIKRYFSQFADLAAAGYHQTDAFIINI